MLTSKRKTNIRCRAVKRGATETLMENALALSSADEQQETLVSRFDREVVQMPQRCAWLRYPKTRTTEFRLTRRSSQRGRV